MALEHAIMVALMERSGSGYELARRFDKSIGYFWKATHQQIYRVLKRMDEAGWVQGEAVAQDGRPDKTMYEVSAAGKAELARWIAEPTDISPFRNELALKLRGAEYGDRDAMCAEVQRHLDQHVERLEVLRLIEKRDFPAPDQLSGTALHQYLVLRAGVRADEGYVEWCGEILDALQPRTERPTDR
ncbi:PadR family transcriptional regulator [Antrihabitans sp. YC2-6]|uniref:PadR family transcriptional regulator n=1 Tax=Antrihabitans sp. YC2-6 TaxID=2799498 RepID=UPI0018F3ADF1|nr:PadR family transcriptional regulator [Antrihabitans sp. YC2-6]MBJ8346738.1 PadR family transcriptional regulator [Antrihabitans sp. YC2-6]